MFVEILSKRLKSVADLINSKKLDKIVVISRNGEIIGNVREIRVKSFDVEGIVISKHFSLNHEFIDKQFIKVFNENEVLLNINPVTSLKGRSVYDSSGRNLGKVRKVLRDNNKNDFRSIVVKGKFFSKPILVEKSSIDIMKKNIILNVEYEKGNYKKIKKRK